MSSSRDRSQTDAADELEETYRLLPAESPPRRESRSRADSDLESVKSLDDTETTQNQPEERRRRKKSRPAKRPADGPEVDELLSSLPHTEEETEWVPDTGWREPSLGSALVYPFTGSGVKLLLLYSVLMWLASLVPFPILTAAVSIPMMIYVSVLLLETANFTLEGIPSGPTAPDWVNWDTITVGLLGLAAFLTAGIPFAVGSWILAKLEVSSLLLQFAFLALAMFYLPMAFLALAERQNERALNPLLVFRGMKRLLGPYAVLCTVASLAYVLPLFVLILLEAPSFVIYFAVIFLMIYVSTALVRAVALIARKRELTFE